MPNAVKIVPPSIRLVRHDIEHATWLFGASCAVIAAERIDGDGDAGIGGAQHGQAGLDGAQPGVMGMLGRADRAVEPVVVA